jgi:hypothetical protein
MLSRLPKTSGWACAEMNNLQEILAEDSSFNEVAWTKQNKIPAENYEHKE